MKTILAAILISIAAAANAQWQSVGPGVDYQNFDRDDYDVHVTRIDLTNDKIAVVGSRESDKGIKVSEFGRRNKAIAAINGDYFDDKFNPIGTTVGQCGGWESARRSKREAMIMIGDSAAKIARQSEVDPQAPAPDWASTAISGWPALVVDCDPLSSKQLPGSDAFTRAPHPRTAVGLSRDRKTMYFVVAEKSRSGVPGLTLAQLASFIADELDACSAMNLDGGGSSAMWVSDHIVNRPADGTERPVGNHLGVVLRSDLAPCDGEEVIATKTTTTTTRTTTTTKSVNPPH